jgi:hypothetical protein
MPGDPILPHGLLRPTRPLSRTTRIDAIYVAERDVTAGRATMRIPSFDVSFAPN